MPGDYEKWKYSIQGGLISFVLYSTLLLFRPSVIFNAGMSFLYTIIIRLMMQ